MQRHLFWLIAISSMTLTACGVGESGTAAATAAAAKAREAEQAQRQMKDIKSQLHSAEALQRDRDKALEAAGR